MTTDIASEEVAYWYLRLNGFFTTRNFVVHPDIGGEQRTDVDIFGVRFPYRAEMLDDPMVDDIPFIEIKDRPNIVIAEVKRRQCNLNGPWTRREALNMQRVLRAIGACPVGEVEGVAKSVYETGVFSNHSYHLSLCCFGETRNSDIERKYPAVPQIMWDQVLTFIDNRFASFRLQKASHGQWDRAGRDLWDSFQNSYNENEFKERLSVL